MGVKTLKPNGERCILDYPLAIEDNVWNVDGSWRIAIPPHGELVPGERFTEPKNAKPVLDKMNEVQRKKGGRPKNSESGSSIKKAGKQHNKIVATTKKVVDTDKEELVNFNELN